MNTFAKLTVLLFLTAMGVESCGQNIRSECMEFNSKYSNFLKETQFNFDTLKAIKILDKAIMNNEKCLDAIITRGDLFITMDSLVLAKRDFQKASVLDTGAIYSFYKLGLIYQMEGVFDSSINNFQIAINKKKLGNWIRDYSQSKENLKTHESKYDIESFELIYQQGISYYYQRNLKDSYSNFSFCIGNKYKLAESYLFRGSILHEAKKDEESCLDFKESQKNGNIEAEKYLKIYCSSK